MKFWLIIAHFDFDWNILEYFGIFWNKLEYFGISAISIFAEFLIVSTFAAPFKRTRIRFE